MFREANQGDNFSTFSHIYKPEDVRITKINKFFDILNPLHSPDLATWDYFFSNLWNN